MARQLADLRQFVRDKHNANALILQRPDLAKQAITEAGLQPWVEKVRCGTDGARLTFMGLPCPNLGTGGANCHGRYEVCSVQEMHKVVEILLNIVKATMNLKK